MKRLILILLLLLVACDTTTESPVVETPPVPEETMPQQAEETSEPVVTEPVDEEPIEDNVEAIEEPEEDTIPVVIEEPTGTISEIQSLTNFSDVPTMLQGLRFVETGREGFSNDIHQNDGRNFPIGLFRAYYLNGETLDIRIESNNPVQNYEVFIGHAYRIAKTVGQLPLELQSNITQVELVEWSREAMRLRGTTLRVGMETMDQLRDQSQTFIELFSVANASEYLSFGSSERERTYWIGLWWASEQLEDQIESEWLAQDKIISTALQNQFTQLDLPSHDMMNIGTGALAPQLVTPNDPSSLIEISFLEKGTRYYPRGDTWSGSLSGSFEANVFQATFANDKTMNFVIESSIPFDTAERIAGEAAFIYGQMPALILAGMRDFIVLPGNGHPSSGPVTTFYYDVFYRLGDRIEEGLIHDSAHASLDWPARNEMYDIKDNRTLLPRPGVTTRDAWLQAARLDNYYVSTYAKDNPEREDIAESIIQYLIVRWRPERFDPYHVQFIKETIPNRIAYLDTFDFGFPIDE